MNLRIFVAHFGKYIQVMSGQVSINVQQKPFPCVCVCVPVGTHQLPFHPLIPLKTWQPHPANEPSPSWSSSVARETPLSLKHTHTSEIQRGTFAYSSGRCCRVRLRVRLLTLGPNEP